MSVVRIVGSTITKYFTIWLVACAGIAYLFPDTFLFVSYIPGTVATLLGIIMLGMGLTMTPNDFKLVFIRPKDVVIGIVARSVIMPGVAFCVSFFFGLPAGIAAGLILLGCCPSGTASNVMCFIGKGDVALSITVSSCVTILAPFMTPYLYQFLGGSYIPIDVFKLLKEILIVVLIPIISGILLRRAFTGTVNKFKDIIPSISVVCIILVLGFVISINAHKEVTGYIFLISFAAVVVHNTCGFILGFWAARLTGMSVYKSKAICFEIGMENSGLCVLLATQHLATQAGVAYAEYAAIPAVIAAIWHNFTGSILANYWLNKAKKTGDIPGISIPEVQTR